MYITSEGVDFPDWARELRVLEFTSRAVGGVKGEDRCGISGQAEFMFSKRPANPSHSKPGILTIGTELRRRSAQTVRDSRVTQPVRLKNLKAQLARITMGQTWERQSPDWRFAKRQSGDWRSQETYNSMRNAS
jgi:hypothetical protein